MGLSACGGASETRGGVGGRPSKEMTPHLRPEGVNEMKGPGVGVGAVLRGPQGRQAGPELLGDGSRRPRCLWVAGGGVLWALPSLVGVIRSRQGISKQGRNKTQLALVQCPEIQLRELSQESGFQAESGGVGMPRRAQDGRQHTGHT